MVSDYLMRERRPDPAAQFPTRPVVGTASVKRRLLNLLTALSMLLCVAVCVLWVRSYSAYDLVHLRTTDRWYHASAFRGRLMVGTWLTADHDPGTLRTG